MTPKDANVFETMLKNSNYDEQKMKFVINGFRHGFSLGYRGSCRVQLTAPNLKLNVGNEDEL